jgi:hypothetical protein
MEQQNMRETNIQRILKQTEEGTNPADLTEIDRNDLRSLAITLFVANVQRRLVQTCAPRYVNECEEKP